MFGPKIGDGNRPWSHDQPGMNISTFICPLNDELDYTPEIERLKSPKIPTVCWKEIHFQNIIFGVPGVSFPGVQYTWNLQIKFWSSLLWVPKQLGGPVPKVYGDDWFFGWLWKLQIPSDRSLYCWCFRNPAHTWFGGKSNSEFVQSKSCLQKGRSFTPRCATLSSSCIFVPENAEFPVGGGDRWLTFPCSSLRYGAKQLILLNAQP